jgi:oligopeptide transport system substrate-binding protein
MAVLEAACSGPARTGQDGALPAPRRGGVLRLVQERPESLDPATVGTVYASLPVNQIFDGLVGLDPGLHVGPALASTWTISRDGRTYVFHLRPDVRFHDGSSLTSADVVFTIERVLSAPPDSRSVAFSYLGVVVGAADFAAGRRSDLPGVVAVDPLTVRIELERPYLSFLEVLAMDGLRIVPRHVVEKLGDAAFGRAPVGTGPFRLADWNRKGLRLTANPDYFAGPPHLDEVDILFLGDDEDDSGAARFDRGEVDVLEVPAEHLERLAREPGVSLHRYQELSLSFLGLLTGTPPLDDVRIRQAVACAIDREGLAARSPATRRYASGILPPGIPAYSPRTKGIGYDPARSRRLLAAAGHADGRGLPPIRLFTTAKSEAAKKVLEQLRANLDAVGIRLEVLDVPWSELNRRIEDHSAPAFLLAWIADLPDPDAFLRTLFESGGSANFFDFHDRETWALLRRGAREMNPVERAKIYRQVEQRILELSPMVPLYHSVGILAVRGGVHGLEPGPLGLASAELEHVWIAPETSDVAQRAAS